MCWQKGQDKLHSNLDMTMLTKPNAPVECMDGLLFLADGGLALSFTYQPSPAAPCPLDREERAAGLAEVMERLRGRQSRVMVEVMADTCRYHLILHLTEQDGLPATEDRAQVVAAAQAVSRRVQELFGGVLTLSPTTAEEFQALREHFPLGRVQDCQLKDTHGCTVTAVTVAESGECAVVGATREVVEYLRSCRQRAFLVLDFVSPRRGFLMRYGLSLVLTSRDLQEGREASEAVEELLAVQLGAMARRTAPSEGARLLHRLSPLSRQLTARHQAYVDNVADLIPA